jgi:hypothetical protein
MVKMVDDQTVNQAANPLKKLDRLGRHGPAEWR